MITGNYSCKGRFREGPEEMLNGTVGAISTSDYSITTVSLKSSVYAPPKLKLHTVVVTKDQSQPGREQYNVVSRVSSK